MTSRTRDDDEEEHDGCSLEGGSRDTALEEQSHTDSEEDQNAVEGQVLRATLQTSTSQSNLKGNSQKQSHPRTPSKRDICNRGKGVSSMKKKPRKCKSKSDVNSDSESRQSSMSSASSDEASENESERREESDSDLVEVAKSSNRKPSKRSKRARENGHSSVNGKSSSKGRGKARRRDASESEPEEEYVVEKIVKHKTVLQSREGRICEYFIKWKGYPASENTWEPEENLSNARKMVDKYWDSVNTKGAKSAKTKERGKKASQSRNTTTRRRLNVQETEHSSSYSQSVEGETDYVRLRASSPFSLKNDDVMAEGTRHSPATTELTLEHYLQEDDWIHHSIQIRQVERDDQQELKVRVRFSNPKKTLWVSAQDVYKRAPQQMLKFYESKIRFPGSE